MSRKSSQNGSSGTPTKSSSGGGGAGDGNNNEHDEIVDDVEDDETDENDASGDDDEGDDKPTVKRSTYLKTLNEAKTAKQKLREYEENERRQKEKKLKESNEYKTLWEQEKARAEELEGKHKSLIGDISNARKVHAFQASLKGVVKPEYHRFINTDAILADPETGEIDENTVAKEVARFQKAHPELVFNPNANKTKSFSPSGEADGKTIMRSEWLKLSDKDMWKWKDSQIIDD